MGGYGGGYLTSRSPKNSLEGLVPELRTPMRAEEFDKKYSYLYGHGDGKHYLQANEVEEFVERLIWLYHNRDQALKLGREANSWMKHWLSWEDHARMILSLATDHILRSRERDE